MIGAKYAGVCRQHHVDGHGRILPHMERMIREQMQLRERNLNDYFLLRLRLFGWRGLFALFFLRCFRFYRG